MGKNLRPQQVRFFDFMSERKAGEVVAGEQVLAATGWLPDTFGTYVRKHKLDAFLAKIDDDQFRVLQDGASLTKAQVFAAFTQVSPGQLTLSKGLALQGDAASYVLSRYCGQGAVAHVWEASSSEGSSVAIKVVNPRPDLLEPTNLPNVRQRFRRESRHGMQLHHPRVVRYRDVGELSDHPFVVMDLADDTLAAMLKKGKLTLIDSLAAVRACLDALEYLHGAGCIHRDVKPANILWFKEHGFVLGDLGIVLWSDMNPAFTSAGTITRASVQLGSWYYMAPEQRRSPHDVTGAADIYALGVSWYEMLVGQTPDPAEIAAKRYTPPSADPLANNLISRMLEFAPKDRPKPSELLIDIRKLGAAASKQQTFGF
jgi:serine/threonine protein kinase